MVALLKPIIQAGRFTVIEEATLEDQLNFIRSFPKHGIFNVAVCDNSRMLVGMQDILPIAPQPSKTRLFGDISTFVAIGEHRKGIGRRLCDKSLSGARHKGYEKLRATIRSDNIDAIAFYESQGFQIIDTLYHQAQTRDVKVDKIVAEYVF